MKDGGGGSAPLKPDTSDLCRALFMHMAEGVALHEITLDAAGRPAGYRIVDVNPQYEHFMGLSRDDMIGKLATEVFGPGDPRRLDVYGQVVQDGRPVRVETHCPFTDRDFEVSVARMGSGFFATIMVEITARKRQEKALREGEWFLQRPTRKRVQGASARMIVGDEAELLLGHGGGHFPNELAPLFQVRQHKV